MYNPTLRQLFERKSMRVFNHIPVPDELKETVLSAATQAPTAGNQQLYAVIDVTDDDVKSELAELCDHQTFIADAPWVLVFVADCLRWYDAYTRAGCDAREPGPGDLMLAVTDACIAAQNTVVAAESCGLGSCYIGDVMENCAQMRRLLGLPAKVFPCAMLVLGYPTEQQLKRVKPPRFPLSAIVSENSYNRLNGAAFQEALAKRETGAASIAFDEAHWITAFCKRKYDSAFAREMSRSVAEYLNDYRLDH